MIIKGYFRSGVRPLPAPFVQAEVYLPRLGVRGYVDFLIDTGADRTVLHSCNTIVLGIDFRRLRRSTLEEMSGVGGSNQYYREDVLLTFIDEDGNLCRFSGQVYLAQKSDPNTSPPSLLGRDILNLCSLYVNRQSNEISISPIMAERPEAQPRLLP